MFYWLTQNFRDFWGEQGLGTFANVFRYQTFRTSMAVLTSFLLTMFLAPKIIRLLRKLKVGSSVDFHMEKINEKYASKKDTPTMGGLIIVSAIMGSTLLWGSLGNFYVFLAMLTVVWLGAVGFAAGHDRRTPSAASPWSGSAPWVSPMIT